MATSHKWTVVAVDDDEINLMILVKNIEDAGYLAMPFLSAVEAWEYLVEHPGVIDMVLVDKMMPDLNGLAMLERIQNHQALKHIPVIIQTSDVGVQQMCEGLEQGAHYYLTKPFHPEVLTAVLHATGRECALREELRAKTHGESPDSPDLPPVGGSPFPLGSGPV